MAGLSRAGRPLLLASRSPRRAMLLAQAGIAYEVADTPPVDESVPLGRDGAFLTPAETVRRLAERKARAAAAAAPKRLVLAADTLVFLDGAPLGKPRDDEDARRMLAALSGQEHEVATGVALLWPDGAGRGPRMRSGAAVTRVRFRPLAPAEIAAYVAGGEPRDKAGAYAIQGGAARFVEAVTGDLDTVIGLPLALVRHLLGSRLPPGGSPGEAAGGR